jgi:hypothetical protein
MGVAGRQMQIGRAKHKPLMIWIYPKIGPSAVKFPKACFVVSCRTIGVILRTLNAIFADNVEKAKTKIPQFNRKRTPWLWVTRKRSFELTAVMHRVNGFHGSNGQKPAGAGE